MLIRELLPTLDRGSANEGNLSPVRLGAVARIGIGNDKLGFADHNSLFERKIRT